MQERKRGVSAALDLGKYVASRGRGWLGWLLLGCPPQLDLPDLLLEGFTKSLLVS